MDALVVWGQVHQWWTTWILEKMWDSIEDLTRKLEIIQRKSNAWTNWVKTTQMYSHTPNLAFRVGQPVIYVRDACSCSTVIPWLLLISDVKPYFQDLSSDATDISPANHFLIPARLAVFVKKASIFSLLLQTSKILWLSHKSLLAGIS